MCYSFENITIVGGGSSGWMTAATFIKFFPKKNISIIESPDYPIVGVGESTLGHINGWMKLLELKDEDFMKETDASYKMSIKFTDFYKKDSGDFIIHSVPEDFMVSISWIITHGLLRKLYIQKLLSKIMHGHIMEQCH